MKKYLFKTALLIVALILLGCNKDDDKQTIFLPTRVEMIYPTSSASYQTLDIIYNDDFSISRVTRSLSDNSKIIYDCNYNELKLLSNLKITEIASSTEKNYQIQYANGYVFKITETNTSGGFSEFNIDYNSVTNTYKYNFPYTWKFNESNDLDYYFFSSIATLQVTYEEGKGFNHFMKPQPVLAILDSYFATNFFQDLYFMSSKPIIKMRFEDLISSDIIEYNYTNTFSSNNNLVNCEIRINDEVNPATIKNITYEERTF